MTTFTINSDATLQTLIGDIRGLYLKHRYLKITAKTGKDRSVDQNAAQFPYLLGFSEQLKWPVNGEMVYLDPLEWKDILTCAFEDEVNPRLAMGFSGGVVMLGKRTSKYNKERFGEWYEWLMAAAALKGVTPVYKQERITDEVTA